MSAGLSGRCRGCGKVRPLAELVEAFDRRRPWRWLVCGPAHGLGTCFREEVDRPSTEVAIRAALTAHLEREGRA